MFIMSKKKDNFLLDKNLDYNPYLPRDKDFFDVNKARLEIDFKKNKAKPVFSVVIPTYNRKNNLKNVLDKFFKQDYPKSKYEIIVIDDGSKDNTLTMVKKLKPICNFKYFYWPRKKIPLKKEFRNLGKFYNRVGPARNIGIDNSKGKIILFNDSDILVEKDCLKRHEEYHKKYPNIVVRGFRIFLPGFKPEKPKYEKKLHCRIYDLSKEGWHRIATPNLSIKKKYLEKVGGFSRDFVFWGFEDTDLGYRLSRNLKLKFIWDENIKVYHLEHLKESGGKFNQFLSFRKGASIMYNKYLDKEIISIFTDAARRRFKKQYADFIN